MSTTIEIRRFGVNKYVHLVLDLGNGNPTKSEINGIEL